YYTSVTEEQDGFLPVTKKTVPDRTVELTKDGTEIFRNVHNSAFTLSLITKYCNSLIAAYFREKGALVMPNFIKATEVWLPADNLDSTGKYSLYRKFSLKVQKTSVSSELQLLIKWEGISKVFKKSVAEMQEDIPNGAYNWVIAGNELSRFKNLPVQVRRDLHAVYPVWNFAIRD